MIGSSPAKSATAFRITVAQTAELQREVVADLGLRERSGQRARIEQFVEQHGKARDLLGDVGRAFAQGQEPFCRQRILVEQRQVGAASQDLLDDAQAAVDGGHRIREPRGVPDHARHEVVETLAGHRVGPPGDGQLPEFGQPLRQLGRAANPVRLECRLPFFRGGAPVPQ